jgi:phosphatidylglycerol:prolipoprotein diacylglycerol transferase
MESTFVINPAHSGSYYALFYLLSFLVGFALLIWEGRKRQFSTVPWMMVVVTAFLFFITGTQIIKFSFEDWQQVLRFQEIEHNSGRSVLGGILFVVPGLLFAKYLLRFRYSLMDAFAFVTPAGMLIQRFGCFTAGCCHGTPTPVPWAVQYGDSSHAFHQQIHDNIIPVSSTLPLPVHPVALYETVGCLIIVVLLFFVIKKRLAVSGNLFIAFVGLYAVVRFFTEFFRAESLGGVTPFGITAVQLAIVLLVPLIFMVIVAREKNRSSANPVRIVSPVSGEQSLIYFLLLATIFLIVSRWLSRLEILTLAFVLTPTLIFIGWQVFKSVTVPHMRLATLGIIGVSMMLMNQTLPESSAPDSTRLSYTVFSLGTMTGNSDFRVAYEDCNGSTVQTDDFKNTFKASAASIARVKQYNHDNIIQYGIDGYWGSHREVVNGSEAHDFSVWGIHPFVQHDWRIVGVGLGIHVGDLAKFSTEEFDDPSVKQINVYPSAYFRVGYLSRFFGEIKIAQQFPSPFPSLGFQTNIGIGFGDDRGGALRIGTGSFAGLFISTSIPVGRHLIFEPYVGGLSGIVPLISDVTEQEPNFVGSISIGYKFARND